MKAIVIITVLVTLHNDKKCLSSIRNHTNDFITYASCMEYRRWK